MAAIYTDIFFLKGLSLRHVPLTLSYFLAACFLSVAIIFHYSHRLKGHIFILRSVCFCCNLPLLLEHVVAHVNAIQKCRTLEDLLCTRASISKQIDRSEETAADIIIPFQMVIWMATNGPLSESH